MRQLRLLPTLILLLFFSVNGIAVPAGLYVSSSGNDITGDGSEQNPFRTIGHAIYVADTLNITGGIGLFVGEGVWTQGTGGTETMPIAMRDSMRIYGAGMGKTIINAGGNSSAVVIEGSFIGLVDLTITGGSAPSGGGIIVGTGSESVYLSNLDIHGNEATVTSRNKTSAASVGLGGGILVSGATEVQIEFSIIRGNVAANEGGAIYIEDGGVSMRHLTITGNSSRNVPAASSVYGGGSGTNDIVSSIIWGNGSNDGMAATVGGNVTVEYSLVENTGGAVFTGTGNGWGDPLFLDPGSHDYHVLQGSPAVDLFTASGPNVEPEPNGGYANAGMYGQTEEATISGANFSLDYGRLYFFGVPVEPASKSPADAFQDDFGVVFSPETWDIYKQGLELSLSGPTAPDFIIEPGRGFFLRQKLFPRATVNVPGYAPPQNETFIRTNLPEIDNGGYAYDWSWVANPFPYPIHLSNTILGVEGAGNIPFPDGAASGLGSRYAYVLGPGLRMIPTTGVLQPWQGVVTLTRNIDEWQVHPLRELPTGVDPTADLDWSLRLDVRAVDSEGDPAAMDQGHLWGFGPTRSDSLDDYDALSIVLADSVFRVESILRPNDQEGTLFHDFRSSLRSSATVWEWVVTAPDTLPSDVEIEFIGIDTTTGYQYPDSNYSLFFSWDDPRLYRGDDLLLGEDLRFVQTLPLTLTDEGNGLLRGSFFVTVDSAGWSGPMSVEAPAALALPERLEIESTFPNPFNPSTTVTVAMSRRGQLEVKVFDVLGRQVRVLENGTRGAGTHKILFDGEGLPSGIYFVRAMSAGQVDVNKVVLLR
jgi:hypothetical protein